LKELLVKPDTIRITAPVLPRETLERVLELIRRDVAEDKVRIDNPTQNLESYFLDVVEKAKQAAAETSGATSGARVADYLRGGVEVKPSTDKILERLSLPEATPAAAAALATAVPATDEKKLADLMKPAEPAAPAPKPAAESKPADLSRADEKLSSLLNKEKK
jgi:hypothetical protein